MLNTLPRSETQAIGNADVFRGCMPAIMTPVTASGDVDYDALVSRAGELVSAGMSGVVYCGSMGDWPLLTDAQRREGVARLVDAGVPVVVGTGAVSTQVACGHAAHAAEVGAAGLMIIPRLLSRGASPAAQANHFARVLTAGDDLPSVIYNSPYYGYQTKADLYFKLRQSHANLIGFKEFGGAASLQYAAEHITSSRDGGWLLVGVDTQVYYGFVHCGAVGAITGIGNCLPDEVLRLTELCRRAAAGDALARTQAFELDEALKVLSTFDEGPDLTLYYRLLASLAGQASLARPLDAEDRLSDAQRCYAEQQLELFQTWYAKWEGSSDA
ncbi:dihydrodipicolinate synthase family protein [Rubripirellula reticaptiva]|uniref:4-hydroxy-tetrahydrodipicolinate synthase n=1 Tax=Rubripirellula reticaptiva TaxID=2528013 RepID=A0A5C6F4S4_9BACT|nr:dihydrodipicolinate synthase family protein [Rubripirellula reticaptiva]TWU56348.1 4-hydroxy-tetrahydrodipicolinate synthase [Rubripirellula reticaptiva]